MTDNTNAPEVTVESLQAALEAEKVAHQDTQTLLDQARADHAQAASAAAGLQTQLATAQAHLGEASSIIAGQSETINDLEAQLVALQTTPAEFPTIKVGNKSYEVRTKGFQYKKLEYTVADLLKDKALQKELVGKGVGFIVEKEA